MPLVQLEGAGVTVELPGGRHRVILSPTTLARLLNGLVEPTSGRVLVDGLDVSRHGPRVRQLVGFCFTDPAAQLVMPTCVEDVELSLRRHERDGRRRRQRALETLDRFGLTEHADDSVHSLSGGQRQLLALAGVLAVEPAVLVADEPTTLLDLANSRRVADLLLDLDQHLVLLTHDLDLAARCDRVLVVSDGAVVHDGPPAAAVSHYLGLVDAEQRS